MRNRSLYGALACLAGLVLAACDSESLVTFEVVVPPETPAGASVSIIGEHPALGGGGPPGLVLTHQGEGVFSGARALPVDEPLSYRVRLTAPEPLVELDEAGAVVADRPLRVADAPATERLSVARWGPASGLAAPVATFLVSVPEHTPPGSDPWLSGNVDALGKWNGRGVRLARTLDGRYAASVAIAVGARVEFKVTRGGWSTVEKGAFGEEIDNRAFVMAEGSQRVDVAVLNWADSSKPPPPQLTGNIQYVRGFASQFLTTSPRDVILWLPPDYDSNPSRRYPVLYMQDGQNLMDASTSFSGEWGVDETAQQRVQAGRVEPVIIVGVYHAGANRSLEYTPVPDASRPSYPGGKAEDYGRFLVEELKPYIDSQYRTKPEAQYTGLAGSSFGGLLTMYLGMKYPTVFTRLGVISPSAYWAQQDLVTRASALPEKLPLRIWADIGTEEGTSLATTEERLAGARALKDALVARGWALEADLKYVEVQGGRHAESAWAARFGDILQYLYPPVP